MAIGAITATILGNFELSGAAIKTALETINVSGAVGSTTSSDIMIVPHGNGQATVFKLTRSAS